MELTTPLAGWFTQLAWNIDVALTGPFLRASSRRLEHRIRLAGLAAELAQREDVHTAHALEVTVIPPIAGGPRYDLALLVHAEEPLADSLVERARAIGLPGPELALTARNGGRFGDTEGRDGEILLNHFAGESSPGRAVEAWTGVSEWYATTLGVDNSTLLEVVDPAPFLIVNYAVIPGRVMPFLAGQLLRPSFHHVVRRRLHDAGIVPYPVFARRVQA